MPKKQKFVNGGSFNTFQMYCGDGTFDSRKVFNNEQQMEMWIKLHKRKCETCRVMDDTQRIPNLAPEVIVRNTNWQQTVQRLNCPTE